jgi:AcrR family transcriptional regulator
MSAEDRRGQVIRAAVAEFSQRGLEGTSTSDIAKRVGVSQPYLFRLFPTKKALFIEACAYSCDRIAAVFTEAAEGKYGVEALSAMGAAYQELLMADSDLLGMQLQQFSACSDAEVQATVRELMQRIWRHVENLSGAPVEARVDYFAKGMLCNVIAAMGRPQGLSPMLDSMMSAMLDSKTATPSSGRIAEDQAYAAYVEAAFTGQASSISVS